VRVQPKLLKRLDKWAAKHQTNRPEAIRRLVELGLKGKR
jgi:metal-responsive CopG/Arc/MetJ family transcriptional regulator